MLGRPLRVAKGEPKERAFVLGRFGNIPGLQTGNDIAADGFWLASRRINGFDCLIVAGSSERGVLYGVFALLSKIARNENLASLDEVQQPYAPIRWVNQWDNLDGRIERGYAGRSIFFDNGAVRPDLSRVRDYARLLASIGLNGCTINNVNANPQDPAIPWQHDGPAIVRSPVLMGSGWL